ncbi:DoxX family protein, partial [candidate division KSB1 bacterium]
MSAENRLTPLSHIQTSALSLMRIIIGWHFLYEGIVKLLNPNWTSAAYLAESRWLFSGLFNWISNNPAALKTVDFLNVWGLILVGLGLFFGLFTRVAIFGGIGLLALYYVANPPLVGLANGMFTEGNYLVVDKNMVELAALVVLSFFAPATLWGADKILAGRKGAETEAGPKPVEAAVSEKAEPEAGISIPRRELIKNLATLPVFGGFIYSLVKRRGWESFEERHLMAAQAGEADAITGATTKTFRFASLKELKGQVPHTSIGDLELSRVILGGNLVGGWAHARDLIYASKLVKAYHTDQKVFDTFRLAEQCGINTFLTNPVIARVINRYWRTQGGKIQFISDSAYKGDVMAGIKVSIDGGAHSCYVQGGIADRLVEEGKLDEINEAVELIRRNCQLGGIGAHKIETVMACVDAGIKPDYWVKTLHHTDYWSANPDGEQNDNIWCLRPKDTIEYMNKLPEPWIAYKTLAAGAIHPTVGFKYAFEGGADFICVGMYDFQVVEDVNIALDVLNADLD